MGAMMASPAARPSVLIVDDSPGVRRAMQELLSPHLGVVLAENGQDALQALTPETALVLSDIRMPGMDGLQLARTLRAQRPGLPVVLMTGVVEDGLRGRARELGVIEVLRKPLRGPQLLSDLQEWLSTEFGPGDAAPAPRPPAPAPADDGRAEAAATLRPVLLLPGVLGAGLYTPGGDALAVGGALGNGVGAYLRFLASAALPLGQHIGASGGGAPRTVQLEYGDRVLVVTPQAGQLLAVLVHDAPGASAVKAWVRGRAGTLH